MSIKNMMVQKVNSFEKGYEVSIKSSVALKTKNILLATGSMPVGVSLAAGLGHRLVPPVPSLFTFQIKDPLLDGFLV